MGFWLGRVVGKAGAHWEQHLHGILSSLGGHKSAEFPGNYYFDESHGFAGLYLCVYVDDLNLAGPTDLHGLFWQRLTTLVDLEEPTEIDRVLGRHHRVVRTGRANTFEGEAPNAALCDSDRAMTFDMEDYAQQCVDLYESLPEAKTLRHASTPFVPDGSLCAADDEERGQLANKACSVLMKCLWLARLARPDLMKPIGDLTSKIQSWSINCDRMVYRLLCYIKATKGYRLTGVVGDSKRDLSLRLYVDADFCGDRLDTKSTNGGYLVLYGPNTWFPLAWVSKKQTRTSRSTTESEVVSLAYSLYLEALPMLTLWEGLLGRKVGLQVMEDNQATILVVKAGWSPKLRHVQRGHKVDLGSLSEEFGEPELSLEYVETDKQAADIFTKGLEPQKWQNALNLLGIRTDINACSDSVCACAPIEPWPP